MREHPGGADQLDAAVRLPAHDRRRRDDGRHARGRSVGAGTCAAATRSRCSGARSRWRCRWSSWPRSSTTFVGHEQAQLMTQQQPMKMAAAEALYDDARGAPGSRCSRWRRSSTTRAARFDVNLPHGLVDPGHQHLERPGRGGQRRSSRCTRRYGPGEYAPVIGVTYWTFRLMTGIGVRAGRADRLRPVSATRGRLKTRRATCGWPPWPIALPLLANATGWIFTEMGRQPWVVQGLLLTRNAVSPTVSAWQVGLTLVGFTLALWRAGGGGRLAHVPVREVGAAADARPTSARRPASPAMPY